MIGESEIARVREGGAEIWYFGYRWVERREMTEAERDLMSGVIQSLENAAKLAIRLGVGVMLLAIPAAFAAPYLGFFHYWVAGLLGVSGFVIFTAMPAQDQPNIDQARRDLNAGEVDVFELVDPGDVLPGSSSPVKVIRVSTGRVLEEIGLTDASEFSAVVLSRRGSTKDLTADELREVKRASDSFHPGELFALFVMIALTVVPGAFLATRTNMGFFGVVGPILLILTNTAFPMRKQLRHRKLSRMLRKAKLLRTKEIAGVSAEVIEGTELAWTVGGLPAKWRRRPAEMATSLFWVAPRMWHKSNISC